MSIFPFSVPFHHMAIRKKLILVIVGMTLLALFCVKFLDAVIDYAALRSNSVQKLETLINLQAHSLSSPLDFYDFHSMAEALQVLSIIDNIKHGCLYDQDGQVLFEYSAKSLSLTDIKFCAPYADNQQDTKTISGLASLTAYKNVTVAGQNVGAILLVYDLSHSYLLFMRHELISIMIISIILLLTYLLSRRLQGMILQPILDLKYVAQQVGDAQNYSLRANKEADDEIGDLIDSFNDMVKTLGDRNIELKQAIKDAREAQKAADLANTMKSDFLAIVSHEIRTPMNGVMGMTDLLLSTDLNAKQINYAKTVMDSAENLLIIINDLLDFSKMESGKFSLDPVPFNLHNTVADLIDVFAVRARDKSLDLSFWYDPQLPQRFIGDGGRIRQIFSNLISNALKFTQHGSVQVVVQDGGREKTDQTRIKIDVIDTGIGISKDAQKTLFKKFTQADVSTARKFGGTGLGLVICKQLCEMMDGHIGVESIEGQGATFSFTLVLKPDDTERDFEELLAPSQQQSALADLTHDARILVVEDNTTNQILMSELLSSIACTFDIVSNGLEAVEHVTSYQYDLIFMDVHMPIMDGLQASKKIRSIEKEKSLPAVPIVALTANAMAGDRERYLKSGMNDYLSKPLIRNDFFAVLGRHLGAQNHQDTENNDDEINAYSGIDLIDMSIFQNRKNQEQDSFDGVMSDAIADVYQHLKNLTDHDGDKKRVMDDLRAIIAKSHLFGCRRLHVCAQDFYDRMQQDNAVNMPHEFDEIEKIYEDSLEEITRFLDHNDDVNQPLSYHGKVDEFDHASLDETIAIVGDNIGALLQVYKDESLQYIRSIDASVAQNDCASVINSAHSLKSSSASLGAVSVSSLADYAEKYAKDCAEGKGGSISGLRDIVVLLHQAYDIANEILDNKIDTV